ncbi:ferritin-like fold-containing protein [Streptomyces netropsis]|uniref:Ring-1,2-phenylacetyl-CoA epoxidase subunit PaaA n=1 Tax=Streptomyces netropsis TaxID=55404 RepID=A0A7W7L8D6_STRNE|nr:ferritin-like fold-containing protein [Streptomyces netropsis]MBB4885460.1 ring-1,2-phenylacetyl-CoA epoxidase subunit PaaA [Streptomyces netropsis]GGR38324.1 ring-oxidation complex protein 1 in the phenylacetic acid catabolism pathway [Streptomyces netropsis]
MGLSLPDDEDVVVRTPEEFLAMPDEYREIALKQMTVNTEGELSGGDDYVQVFLPLAPTAEERQVCAERAVEEYDHYKIGKRVLASVGVDTTYMERQTLAERNLFADQTLHTCTTWAERGIFSYIGEETAMIMIKEFSESSFKPWAEAVRTIILDEKIHIAHGARVCRGLAASEEGREQLQTALDRLWPTFVKIFGSPRSERAKLAVRFGLRRTTNGEACDLWRQRVIPRVKHLGLAVPE